MSDVLQAKLPATGLLAGDPQLFTRLYAQHHLQLKKVIAAIIGRPREQTADDLLQETFMRIWKYRHLYDERKASFEVWSRRIAINRCIKYVNKCRFRYRIDQQLAGEATPKYVGVEPLLRRVELNRLLAGVSCREANLLRLRYYEGYSQAKTAKLLGEKLWQFKRRDALTLRKIRSRNAIKTTNEGTRRAKTIPG